MHQWQNVIFRLLYIVIGIFSFIYLVGMTPINPNHTNWIKLGYGHHSCDIIQAQVGWLFFVKEPWHFPLSNISNYIFPSGTSLTYTNSIPLLAIPLKLFKIFLPDNFQYFGLWGLICFLLQSLFAGLILEQGISNRWLPLLGIPFFTICPILVFRLFGHCELIAQWTILAGWYLFIRNNHTQSGYLQWILLLGITILIGPYLLVMVFIIYIGFEINALVYQKTNIKQLSSRFMLFLSLFLFLAWSVAGIFGKYTLSMDPCHLSYFNLNLNSLWSPWGFSFFSVPHAENGQYEGLCYLGMGFLLLIIITCMIRLWSMLHKKTISDFDPGKIFIIVVCTIIALGTTITFNEHTIFSYTLPNKITYFLAFFRVARFIWPVYYLIIFSVLLFIFKKISNRNSINYILLIIVTTSLIIQMIEFSKMANENRAHYPLLKEKRPVLLLQSNSWKDIAKNRKHIFLYPNNTQDGMFINARFAYYAIENNLTLSTGYLARENINQKTFLEKIKTEVSKNQLQSDYIYIFRPGILAKATVQILANSKVHIKYLDGFIVLYK